MILIDIQANIIKAQKAIDSLENDNIYRVYKSLGGSGNLEMQLRKLLNDSINLRNTLSAILHGIIMSTKDKELIKIIELGYFDKITEAASKESLFKIITLGSGILSIPETASKVVAESKIIALQMDNICSEINNYNIKILTFRQQRNKMIFTLYRMPDLKDLPQLIERGVTLHGLLDFTDLHHISAPESSKIKEASHESFSKSAIETTTRESVLKGKMVK